MIWYTGRFHAVLLTRRIAEGGGEHRDTADDGGAHGHAAAVRVRLRDCCRAASAQAGHRGRTCCCTAWGSTRSACADPLRQSGAGRGAQQKVSIVVRAGQRPAPSRPTAGDRSQLLVGLRHRQQARWPSPVGQLSQRGGGAGHAHRGSHRRDGAAAAGEVLTDDGSPPTRQPAGGLALPQGCCRMAGRGRLSSQTDPDRIEPGRRGAGVLAALMVLVAMVYGAGPAALVEMFPTRIRTAMSLPYHLGVAGSAVCCRRSPFGMSAQDG